MKALLTLHKKSLAKQLLLGFGLSLATIGLSTLWVNYHLVQRDLKKQVRERALSITQTLEFSTEGLLEIENKSILQRVVQNYSTLPAVMEIAIIAPEGAVLAHTRDDYQGQLYRTIYPELATTMQEASRQGVAMSHLLTIDDKPVLAQVLPFSSVLFGTSGQRGLAIAIVDLKQMRHEAEQTFYASTFVLLGGLVIILLFLASLIQQKVLSPLKNLAEAVSLSKQTGAFTMPNNLSSDEMHFLATTFSTVFRQLEAYERLNAEINQRKQIEMTLRESEARERAKSQELEVTLTELRQMQAQLIQSEKMSSLGQLVAGVAHEINNPINFIHGNIHHAHQYLNDLLDLLHLYQRVYPQPEPNIQAKADEIELEFLRQDLPKMLSSMQVGADRIREIVRSLRAFSRLDEAEVKNVDIHEGIDSTLMILRNRLRAKPDYPAIEVVKHYSDLPKVECYAGQLNQVFMNILSNAIDALEDYNQTRAIADIEANPGRITIQTECLGSERIAIRIADNGPGMTSAIQTRIFDPFFTTKVVGKGTGMGMSISHQIITEKHRGTLRCISSPGQGAEFIIEIPTQQGET